MTCGNTARCSSASTPEPCFQLLLAAKFQLYAEDHARFTGDRALDKVRELNPSLQSFNDWLAKHRDEFKL